MFSQHTHLANFKKISIGEILIAWHNALYNYIYMDCDTPNHSGLYSCQVPQWTEGELKIKHWYKGITWRNRNLFSDTINVQDVIKLSQDMHILGGPQKGNGLAKNYSLWWTACTLLEKLTWLDQINKCCGWKLKELRVSILVYVQLNQVPICQFVNELYMYLNCYKITEIQNNLNTWITTIFLLEWDFNFESTVTFLIESSFQ